jgi:DNA-binding SARP family transcriptional activator/tetratricopeptide (TPR) repeat protein
MGAITVGMLGSLEVTVEGAPVDLGGRQQRAVLALLVSARGQVVSVDRVIDQLWSGEPPASSHASLQTYVSRLRRLLEPGRGARDVAMVLVSAPPGYAIRLDDAAVDAWHFESVVRSAEQEREPGDRLVLLRHALALWRGPAWAEFRDEPWALPEAIRADELRLRAKELFIESAIATGAFAEAVIEGEAIVREAPLHEEGWRLLVLAHYAAARRADALATLRRARRVLVEELGVDLGTALQQLEYDVLAQQVVLPAAPRPAAVTAAQAPPAEPVSAVDAFAVDEPPSARIVGRDQEIDELVGAAAAASAGWARAAVISGEPGAGKTALLGRVCAELSAAGWRVGFGRCPEVDGAPPAWAWAEALRSLARHAPVGRFAESLAPLLFDQAVPLSGDAAVARFRQNQAVAEWLSSLAPQPVAIVLDDLHAADPETAQMLIHVATTPTANRLFLLLAHRSEGGGPLTDVMAGIANLGAVRIELGGLDTDAARELVAAVTDVPLPPRTLAALIERTGGNPFYLKESARLLASEGAEAALTTVPAGVADVLTRRIARLPEPAQQVLRLAAAIGLSVVVDVLLAASSATEASVIDGLEAAELAGLLVEEPDGRIAFTHNIIRDTLYAQVPAVRRRGIHAAIVDALTATAPQDVAALAHHATLAATPATAVDAARYCLAAGQLAESRCGYDAAVDHYRDALASLERSRAALPALRLQVLLRLVPAMVRAGDRIDRLRWRQEAVRLAGDSGDMHLLAQAISCGNVPSPWSSRDYLTFEPEFVTVINRVLSSAELTDHERCSVLNSYARETIFSAQDSGNGVAVAAVELARQVGDPELLALSLVGLAERYLPDLDIEQRAATCAELRGLADAHGLLSFVLAADIFDAHTAAVLGRLADYRRHLDAAVELAGKLGLTLGILAPARLESVYALMIGDYDRFEMWFDEHLESTRGVGGITEEQLNGARYVLASGRGQLATFVDTARYEYDNRWRQWAGSLALCLAAAGRIDEAREIMATAPDPPRNLAWTLTTYFYALAAAAVDDRELAAKLYPQLVPLHNQIAGANTFPHGPVAFALGNLSLCLGRIEQARKHFAEGLDIAGRCGNRVWAAWIQADLDRCPAVGSDGAQ